MRLPAALVAVPLLIGASTGILLADTPDPTLPLCAAAGGALAFVAALALFLDGSAGVTAAAAAAGCALCGISLGLTAARCAYRPDLLVWFDARDERVRNDPVLLEGVLREDAAVSAAGVSLTLEVFVAAEGGRGPRHEARGGVRLTVGGAAASDLCERWRAGRAIRVPALLRKPSSYGDPGQPDNVRGLARRGVSLVGTVKSGSLVEVIRRGSRIDEAAAAARRSVRGRLTRYVGRWNTRSAAIAAAILIGDRSGLSDADERRLQEAGTYHVIAISGGNIAILAALILGLLHACRVHAGAAAGLAILALVFYGQLAAGGASVFRAVTAACVYLGGRMLDQRGPPLNALAVAAASGLALAPLVAFDSGFILSFGASLGILLGAPRLVPAPERHEPGPVPRKDQLSPARRALQPFGRAARALFIATVCAELALIPAGAFLFSRITVAGLALNFLAIPLMTLVQAAAMATLALAPLSPAAAFCSGYVTHAAAAGLLRSASVIDFAPWLSVDVVPPAWWLVVAYYGCGVLLLFPRSARCGAVGVAAAAVLMVHASSSPGTLAPRLPAGGLRVVFLDVGQGDSTLVRMPDGRVLVIDAGGSPGAAFDVGERVVAPALRALGVWRIDTLVLTHGDPDHIGGVASLLRRFGPHVVWEGIPVPPHPLLRDIRVRALAAGVSWREVRSGDRERDGAAEIRILHPPPPDWERQRVRNEDSVVIELRLGEVSIVLPGDIGREAEERLAPTLATRPITILKAPHHGSATSSTAPFIAAAHPAAVIFSAGRGNRFGHPAPAVVDRYRAANCRIFRTDEDGAIALDTDGRSVAIRTWSGRQATLPQ